MNEPWSNVLRVLRTPPPFFLFKGIDMCQRGSMRPLVTAELVAIRVLALSAAHHVFGRLRDCVICESANRPRQPQQVGDESRRILLFSTRNGSADRSWRTKPFETMHRIRELLRAMHVLEAPRREASLCVRIFSSRSSRGLSSERARHLQGIMRYVS